MANKFSLCRLLLLLAFSAANGALAYTPPIGIPDPQWGAIHPIDTKAPSWPSEWPSTTKDLYYYIDPDSPNATDTSNPNGTPDKPRMTLPKISYAAGSYVEVHGHYDQLANFRIAMHCTEQKPCWLRGDPADMPTITKSITLWYSSYVFVENLKFANGANSAITVMTGDKAGDETDHISLRNIVLQDRDFTGSTSGINLYPTNPGKLHDIVVYNSTFSNLGTNISWDTGDPDFHGVGVNGYGRDASLGTEAYNIWILGNTCSRISGNCVQVIGQNCGAASCTKLLHHIYIGKNVAHSNRQSGFWTKEASDVIFSQNLAYDNRRHGLQPGDGIGYQYGPDNVWIIYNEVYDSNYGIRQSDTASHPDRNIYIIGNLLHNIHPEDLSSYSPNDDWRTGIAISLWQGGENRYIVDNTIYDVTAGINSIYSSPIYVDGNIISDVRDGDYLISATQAIRNNNLHVGENLFYDGANNAPIKWDNTIYHDLASFIKATGQCANCIDQDPEFVDTVHNNFTLKSSSPAINKEPANSVYETFYNRYGINIKVDFNGNPRDALPDFGAFENLGNSVIAPSAPKITDSTVKEVN